MKSKDVITQEKCSWNLYNISPPRLYKKDLQKRLENLYFDTGAKMLRGNLIMLIKGI